MVMKLLNKKSLLWVFLTLLIVLFFFPGSFHSRLFNSDCDSYCKDPQTYNVYQVRNCTPLIDGSSTTCLGIPTNDECNESGPCYQSCSRTCFGLVVGTGAAPNFIEAKIMYVLNLFK